MSTSHSQLERDSNQSSKSASEGVFSDKNHQASPNGQKESCVQMNTTRQDKMDKNFMQENKNKHKHIEGGEKDESLMKKKDVIESHSHRHDFDAHSNYSFPPHGCSSLDWHAEGNRIPSNPFAHDPQTIDPNSNFDIEQYYKMHAIKAYQSGQSEQLEAPTTSVEEMLDRFHFYSVIHTISTYEKCQDIFCQNIFNAFMNLKQVHRDMIHPRENILNPIVEAVKKNIKLFNEVLQDYTQELHTIELIQNSQLNLGFSIHRLPSQEDISKLRSTLKQCVRDWSSAGKKERDACYLPILNELEKRFPERSARSKVKVLSPGSGLGRLPYEIAKRGFSSEGNEFSYFMLIMSNFFLNRASYQEQFEIFPWINSKSNLQRRSDQLISYKIPDEIPAEKLLHFEGNFSMAAGDFIELYTKQEGEWDVICTCFFIDTAKNIFEYLETIRKALKNGGMWINLGPLLYHFEGMDDHFSIELAHDELLYVISTMGFVLEKQEFVQCPYANRSESMLQQIYNCTFFMARIEK